MVNETERVMPLTCHGHSRPVTHISFSAVTTDEQYYLVSACKDGNPMLRDGITGDWIGTFLGHKGATWQARLSEDATLAATASADFTAKVWDTFTGEALHTLEHNHIVRAVAFPPSPRPLILATGGFEKKLRIWDISGAASTASAHANGTSTPNGSTDPPSSYEIGAGVHQGTIKSIVWASNDTNIFVTAAEDKKIRWWDLRARSQIGEYEVDGAIGSCELNTTTPTSGTTVNDQGILSVAAGKNVYFFDGATRPEQLLTTHKLQQEVASVAVNLAERKFVTGGGSDTWVRVYDLDSGEELEVGKGHHGPVWSVCFSPDGKLYATGSEDGTVKLWRFNKGEPYGLWR